MDPKQIRNELKEALLYLLWDQWVALGFEGNEHGRKVPFIIDPEALLLASLRFATKEGRFGEAVSGWLEKNGETMSIQRLKNLQLATQLAPQEALHDVSQFMEGKGHRNWKTLSHLDIPENPAHSASDGFILRIGRPVSQKADTTKTENLLLRLRLIFGISARPEILAWMLTHRSGHAAKIARDTGWYSRSVQAILSDFEEAGMLGGRYVGKRKEYSKLPQNDMWDVFCPGNTRWLSQAFFYRGIQHVLDTLENSGDSDVSDHARAISIRSKLMSLEAAFAYTEHGELFAGVGKQTGANLIGHFNSEALALLDLVRTRDGLGEL